MDVIVSAMALLAFTRIESARLGIRRRWLVVVAVLTVGVSLGLPLFLYLRELALEQKPLLARDPGVLRASALFRINSGTSLLPDIVLIFGCS
jgi:hypothetical protein